MARSHIQSKVIRDLTLIVLGFLSILSLATLVVLTACDIEPTSLPIERSETLGRYRSTYLEDAVELIVLRADSTYEHTYQPQGDTLYVQTGTWEFLQRAHGDGPRVRFKGFVNWYPLDLNCYSTGSRGKLDISPRGWMPYIKKLEDGAIQISRCPNNRQFYVLENRPASE